MSNSGIRILLVEDNLADARLLQLLLEERDSFPSQWTHVQRISEAIEQMSVNQPDAILLDLSLPDGNGIETLTTLRPYTSHLPIIVITGTDNETLALNAMHAGAQDYLVKGHIDGELLARTLRYSIERKQAEEEMSSRERRFRALIENAPDGIALLGLDGKLQQVTPTVQQILGYTIDESIGQDPAQYTHPDDLPRLLELLSDLIQNPGKVARTTYRFRHKDGTWRWLESTVSNLLSEPGVNAIVFNYRDVTERRQAELHIRHQSRLLENVSDAIISTDTEFKITSWNPAAEQMYGWCAEEVIGKPVNEVFSTQYEKIDSQRALRDLQQSGSWQGEAIQQRKDGTLITVLSSVSQLKDSNGTVMGVVAINRDITERKQAEQKLLESQEEFRNLFEDSPISLWVEDFSDVKLQLDKLKTKGIEDIPGYLRDHPEFVMDCARRVRILDVNSAGVKLYHARSKAELLGNLLDVLPDVAVEQFTHELILLQNGQLNFQSEQVDRTLTGEEIYVSIRWTVVPGYENTLGRVIISTIDISERRQAEKKVQRQVERLNGLRAIDVAISSSVDMQISLNIVLRETMAQLGVDAAAILLVDAAGSALSFAAAIGFRTSAIEQTNIRIGEGLAGRVASERRPIHIPSLEEAQSNFLRKELLKDEFFYSYFAIPLIAKGELKGVMEIFHRSALQVTAEWLSFLETLGGQAAIAIENAQLIENLHRSNAELEHRVAERTAELERANRTKDEFLATMSHELRTPLNSILGLSESLLEQRRGQLNEHQQNSLNIITSSGQHLLELINDILDLSKIEAGKLDFYPQPISVDDFCRSCLVFVRGQAVRKHILLTYTREVNISRIYADPRRIKQILINLLTNAVKFSPEKGQVTLHVNGDPEQDLISFSVIDEGIGIAQEDLGRLFHPFVQVDSSLTRQYQGTGLGLALVQKLTDLHGGSVHVESELGKGSRFTVNLACNLAEIARLEAPAASPDSEAQPSEKSAVVRDAALQTQDTILVVDDNMANILTVGDYLESYGYNVVIAHDGMEAIQKAEAVSPGIILMDIQMPVMNGLDATMQLRSDERFANTPIIAFTALAMPGDRERCLAAGANDYMSKPVSLKALVSKIQGFLKS